MNHPVTPLVLRLIVGFVLMAWGWSGARGAQPAPTWEPIGKTDVFPSSIISSVRLWVPDKNAKKDPLTIGNESPGFGFRVTAEAAGPLMVEVSCSKFMQPSLMRAQMPAAGVYKIWPVPKWDFDALYSVTEPEPAIVTFRVLDMDGRELDRADWPVIVHSVNECVIAERNETTKKMVDTTRFIAAYVNENHPRIASILLQALTDRRVKRFDGPLVADAVGAMREIEAIWKTLKAMRLSYSSIAKVGTEVADLKTQNIRFLEEALNHAQANCVDGSVLLASIFINLGVDASLVMLPSHCLVKVTYPHLGDVYLETTVLAEREDLDDAIKEGLQRYQDVAPRFGKSPGFNLVNVREIRKAGILPLRSRRGAAALR